MNHQFNETDSTKVADLKPLKLIGALAGDIIGSVYEKHNIKITKFPLFTERSRFTDDTVLTIATASKLINNSNYVKEYQIFGRKYQKSGFGPDFKTWIFSGDPKPYNSYGNGAAMRVSPIGYANESLAYVMKEAKSSAEITHNHPEGIKGAQAVASAVFLAKNGASKKDIRDFINFNFNYNLSRKIDDIRLTYNFDVSCQGSVPEAITAFLESNDFENAIRIAISLGGDSDTIASITGGISEAFYKEIPEEIMHNVIKLIPDEFLSILIDFTKIYP